MRFLSLMRWASAAMAAMGGEGFAAHKVAGERGEEKAEGGEER